MSFGNAPQPQDANVTSQLQQAYNTNTANQQQQYNLQTAAQQQQYNQQNAAANQQRSMVNQVTPMGALTYGQSGTNPDGTPKYTSTVSLSPEQQQLYNQYTQTQGITGGTAQNLAKSMSGMYGQTPNINFDSTLKGLQGWQQAYVNPIFRQQEATLDSKLRAQGILPGSAAYNNAQNLQARNEGDVNNQFFQQAEPLAFNQAVTQYQLPLQTYETLLSGTGPTSPQFGQTPGFNAQNPSLASPQIQPPNYMGAQQNAFQNQLQNYQNQQAGMWGLAGKGLGIAGTMLGGPIGGAIGSGIGGMFGNSPGTASTMNYGGQSWPMYS